MKEEGQTLKECTICNKQKGLVPVVGGVIYEDDLVYASHIYDEEEPTDLGYLMAETKRHVHTFADLTDAQAQAIGLLITGLSRALKACVGADLAYAVFFAEVVPHLHVLITARYPNTPPEYWRTKVYD